MLKFGGQISKQFCGQFQKRFWSHLPGKTVTGNKVYEVQNLGPQSPALYRFFFELIG